VIIASVLAYVAAVTGLSLLVMWRSLLANSPLAIAVQIAAVLLMIWARLTFGMRSFHLAANPTAGGLVTAGPYRVLRHPVYAAVIWFAWAGVACHWSTRSILAAIVVTAGLVTRMLLEEAQLRSRYPEYPAYMAQTRRVVPYIV
jgi:protein-S-isoprenylcysteine O-methyltransferase Ste14